MIYFTVPPPDLELLPPGPSLHPVPEGQSEI